jgi:hypothetical protein
MNAILTNSIPDTNLYVFLINHENGHSYGAIITLNENSEFISTEVYDRCHEDVAVTDEVLYNEIIDHIKNNWEQLVSHD